MLIKMKILFVIKNSEFLKCTDKSIDYAVMEKTRDALVLPLNANWSDIGSWDALMDAKRQRCKWKCT